MQTILGSGGAIGTELAKALTKYTSSVRLVSRNPKAVNENDELVKCNLLNQDEANKAVKGSDVAYLTIGLPYKTKTWQEQWPVVVSNVIGACKMHKSKLVFFDNIYMLDPEHLDNITEETPINPASKKGKLRAKIAKMVMDAAATKEIEALIARSADFYGPGINNGVLNEVVLKNLKNGKKANWLCSLDYKHSFTYTPDAAKATALLGNTDVAYRQVWNLPTAPDPLTGKEWVEAIAKELGVKPKVMVASKFMVKLVGLFNPIMRELVEMLYQYDRDYCFNSSKFNSAFDFETTPYKEGIRKLIS